MTPMIRNNLVLAIYKSIASLVPIVDTIGYWINVWVERSIDRSIATDHDLLVPSSNITRHTYTSVDTDYANDFHIPSTPLYAG